MSNLHICRGTNTRYLSQTRRRGCRRWTTVGKSIRIATAGKKLMRSMLGNRYAAKGRVLLTQDRYEPTVVMQVTR